MKNKMLFSSETGALFLIFAIVTAIVGTVGYVGIRVAQSQGQQYSHTLDDIAAGRPLTDEQLTQAQNSFHNQIRVLGATGNFITAVDVNPDGRSVSGALQQVIQDQVERRTGTRSTRSNPLPTDVDVTAGSRPTPTATPNPTATATPNATATPEPTATPDESGCANGVFACSNGQTICSELACNQTANCSDGSDENPALCGQADSCCVATRGCPGETGSSCASSCCCCGYGQACNQSDWASGCAAAATRVIRDWDDVVDALEKDIMAEQGN
jgi:hypothetical protein